MYIKIRWFSVFLIIWFCLVLMPVPVLANETVADSQTEAAAAQFISDRITKEMTDFEKEMQIIGYLVEHVDYAYNRYLEGNSIPEDYEAYGALIHGEAVCSGYTEAFLTLAESCGLEARKVLGDVNGIPHTWNQVKLEGDWYHVDVTWEDPIVNGSVDNGLGFGSLCNDYINLTDAQMEEDHNWEAEGIVCAAVRYGQDYVSDFLVFSGGFS